MYAKLNTRNRPVERLEVALSWGWLWLSTLVGLALLVALWAGVFWLLSFVWENGLGVAKMASYIGLGVAIVGYLFSEPLVVLATKADKLPKDHHLYQMVDHVAKKARIRTPRVYLIPDEAANAFATGVKLPIPFIGGRGAVGLTRGIVRLMDEEELEGVIAHELTHLKSGDLILATMASALIIALSIILRIIMRSPRLLGQMTMGGGSRSSGSRSSSRSGRKSSSGGSGAGCGAILLALVKFLLAILITILIIVAVFLITQVVMPMIRAWLNRQREYWADCGSAAILGTPDPLIKALGKLKRSRTEVDGVGHFNGAFFNAPAFAVEDSLDRLFSTHPDTDARIENLHQRADGVFNL